MSPKLRMLAAALDPEGHRFPSRTKRLIELWNDVLRAEAPACKLKSSPRRRGEHGATSPQPTPGIPSGIQRQRRKACHVERARPALIGGRASRNTPNTT